MVSLCLNEKPHVVCIPYPAQGHINPMLKLAKLLHFKGYHITFVNTEFNHKRLLKSRGSNALDGLPSFRFATIPDGLPPTDVDATQDIPGHGPGSGNGPGTGRRPGSGAGRPAVRERRPTGHTRDTAPTGRAAGAGSGSVLAVPVAGLGRDEPPTSAAAPDAGITHGHRPAPTSDAGGPAQDHRTPAGDAPADHSATGTGTARDPGDAPRLTAGGDRPHGGSGPLTPTPCDRCPRGAAAVSRQARSAPACGRP